LSLHGQLTELGYEPAAECSDCHGAHDILPVNDPQSRLAGANRLQTCRQCHQNAVAGFAGFDPHASHKDAQNYPVLHGFCYWLELILLAIFGVFMIHALAWFVRSFLQTLIYGRPRRLAASERAIRGSETSPRVVYVALLISFPGLALTGLPLKYSSQPWAGKVANLMGGFDNTSIWHHFFAVIVMAACVWHLAWAIRRIASMRARDWSWKRIVFGPDSSVLRGRDLRDLGAMLRWFVGLGKKPGFERWTYWEKSDYWFTYYAAAIVVLSGLCLWQPNLVCRFLPGSVLNLAKSVHSEIALMAASFLFGIHLFNVHMRPEKFPVDLSIFTGLVSEAHLRRARPDYVERLSREGLLEERQCDAPPKRRLLLVAVAALALLLVGLVILLAVIFAQLGK
jgi:cytochrome b subunit of formate dehydrogenase